MAGNWPLEANNNFLPLERWRRGSQSSSGDGRFEIWASEDFGVNGTNINGFHGIWTNAEFDNATNKVFTLSGSQLRDLWRCNAVDDFDTNFNYFAGSNAGNLTLTTVLMWGWKQPHFLATQAAPKNTAGPQFNASEHNGQQQCRTWESLHGGQYHGVSDTAIGNAALEANVSGNGNIAIGASAGILVQSNNNIRLEIPVFPQITA